MATHLRHTIIAKAEADERVKHNKFRCLSLQRKSCSERMEGRRGIMRSGGNFSLSVDKASKQCWWSGHDGEIMAARSGSAAVCHRPYRWKYTRPTPSSAWYGRASLAPEQNQTTQNSVNSSYSRWLLTLNCHELFLESRPENREGRGRERSEASPGAAGGDNQRGKTRGKTRKGRKHGNNNTKHWNTKNYMERNNYYTYMTI